MFVLFSLFIFLWWSLLYEYIQEINDKISRVPKQLIG